MEYVTNPKYCFSYVMPILFFKAYSLSLEFLYPLMADKIIHIDKENCSGFLIRQTIPP